MTKNEAIGKYLMNADNTAVGGWEKCELRAKMNSGEIWNLMPSDFQSKVKPVRKLTNNVDGADKNAAITATTDKLFLLSYSEIVETPQISFGWSEYPWIGGEGSQYEAFKGRVTNNYSGNDCLKIENAWWERSLCRGNLTSFYLLTLVVPLRTQVTLMGHGMSVPLGASSLSSSLSSEKARTFLCGLFFWQLLERFEVRGTGCRVEGKWGHTAALRAPAALPRHYLRCALV